MKILSEKKDPKKCIVCGNPIFKRGENSVTCSKPCSKTYHRIAYRIRLKAKRFFKDKFLEYWDGLK